MITVVAVDERQFMRDGFVSMLATESEIELVEQVGTAEEAVAAVRAARPDVAVVGLWAAGTAGLDACRCIVEYAAAEDLPTRVLTVAGSEERGMLRAALGIGARGFVLTDSDRETFLLAIKSLAAGYSFPDPKGAEEFLAFVSDGSDEHGVEALSAPERRVAVLLPTGLSNSEIGERLGVSINTVRSHLKRVYRKLEVGGREEAIALITQLQAQGELPTAAELGEE